MISLRDIQSRFYQGALHGQSEAIEPFIADNELPAAGRFRVYQNNVRESFRKTLAQSYPVIERLVGDACFAGLARDYMRERPSRCGDLQQFGRHYPAFLAGRYGDTPFAWLSDVAKLEWACQQVLTAPDDVPLDPQSLASVSSADYPALRLRHCAASRLVRSDYPVQSIWQANQPAADGTTTTDLHGGGEAVLVCRQPSHLEVRVITPATFALLAALRCGLDLDTAFGAALAFEPDFALDTSLALLFRLGLFKSFSIRKN